MERDDRIYTCDMCRTCAESRRPARFWARLDKQQAEAHRKVGHDVQPVDKSITRPEREREAK